MRLLGHRGQHFSLVKGGFHGDLFYLENDVETRKKYRYGYSLDLSAKGFDLN